LCTTIFYIRFSAGDEKSEPSTLKIGSNNVFEVYSTIDGVKSIGDNNIFESKSLSILKQILLQSFKNFFKILGYVGKNLSIGNDCVIGAGCHLTSTVPIEDGICIYGKNCIRQKAFCKPSVSYNCYC